MYNKENKKLKHWKDLNLEEETDFILWWRFLENSVKACLLLINGIEKPEKDSVKINILWEDIFIRMMWICDSIEKLTKYLGGSKGFKKEKMLWVILDDFRQYIKKSDIRFIRDAIEHREQTFLLCDKKRKKVAINETAYLYGIEKGFYKILNYEVDIKKMFNKIKKFKKELKNCLKFKKYNFWYKNFTTKINMLHPGLILNSFDW